MTLNRSRTAVVVGFKYKVYNYLGYLLVGGVPIGYLAVTRNLFNLEKTANVTSWGVIAIIIASLTMWGKIKEVIKDYNTYLGNISKRAKLPIISGTALTISLIAYVSIGLLIGVLGSLTVGGVLALYPFALYDSEHQKALEMTAFLKKENSEKTLIELKQLQSQKQKKATNR